MIVRPAEPAHPRPQRDHRVVPQDRPRRPCRPTSPTCSSRRARSRAIPSSTVAMIDDWVAHGAESRYALAPDEVVRRSRPATTPRRPRPRSSSSASTCTAPATTRPRSRTGAKRTACIPTTGRTSARRGTSRTRCARATPTRTTAVVRGHQEDRRRELLPADRPLTRSASRLGRRQFRIGEVHGRGATRRSASARLAPNWTR